MSAAPAAAVDRIAEAVTEVIERVFDTVGELRPAALRVLEDEGTGAAAGTGLEDQVAALLGAPGQFAVGMGVIVAPRAENGFRRGLHWWQVDPAADRLVMLAPDLRASSLGFYDYTAADWFDVPRRTGRRHVVGPYVDVHGTGRYLLTLTGPVVSGGEFLGVVGADVPVTRFEGHLLRALTAIDVPFLVLNGEDRVVLSTAPRWLVGDLLPSTAGFAGPGGRVPGVPWRVQLAAGDGRPLVV
jgi:hypothetical protein